MYTQTRTQIHEDTNAYAHTSSDRQGNGLWKEGEGKQRQTAQGELGGPLTFLLLIRNLEREANWEGGRHLQGKKNKHLMTQSDANLVLVPNFKRRNGRTKVE